MLHVYHAQAEYAMVCWAGEAESAEPQHAQWRGTEAGQLRPAQHCPHGGARADQGNLAAPQHTPDTVQGCSLGCC